MFLRLFCNDGVKYHPIQNSSRMSSSIHDKNLTKDIHDILRTCIALALCFRSAGIWWLLRVMSATPTTGTDSHDVVDIAIMHRAIDHGAGMAKG